MAVARREISAVNRVVKQLPVEMLQQCLSANSCMRTRIVMEEHYTGCQHSMSLILNGPTHFFSVFQYTSDVIVVPCMNSTISTLLLSQKTAVISFIADNVCLNFLGLLCECVCIHCFDCSSVSIFTKETQASSPVIRTMWLINLSPSL
jgi:hypothetical protein